MSYFSEAYPLVRLPIADVNTPGLRRAQLGGIHALAAHFSLNKEPAIIVMPTGSGKTAVIFLSGFILRATRMLIMTPSRLVRSQIAQNAATLNILKEIGSIPRNLEVPRVTEVRSRRTSLALWEELRDADVVVSTPHCISPGIEGVLSPPKDLFDLVIADEAHHSEAPRWSDILSHFQQSSRALFTATPFRRDRRELKGRLVYHYPIREAFKDGIFGKLRFIPVNPQLGTSHDVALAKETESVFRKDKEAGLEHCVMVRTDNKTKANELKEIYQQNTQLRLQLIHSDHSVNFINRTLGHLKNGDLDGVICVAMLGEGFDFPRLKVAAIHAPHKSLAVTLQFIGRFARTAGANLGEAKFLAVPQDIQAETEELYHESAVWQELVSNLSASRTEEEVRAKEIAASFSVRDMDTNVSKDLSLDAFQPYFHVSVYRIANEPDFNPPPSFDDNTEIIWQAVSEDFLSVALLLRQVTKPRWTDREAFSRIEHDLVILYFNEEAKLLFICSTRRSLEFYRSMGDHYGNGSYQILSLSQINRVLAGITNPEFFNVGMKCSAQNSNTESYRIITGPNAQKSISATDGRLFHRGHVFGKGETSGGELITLGYSSASKIWSNQNGRISDLILWCEELAKRLNSNTTVKTNTELDFLATGEEISQLPPEVISAGWPEDVYKHFPRGMISIGGAAIDEIQLADVELQLLHANRTPEIWPVRLAHTKFDRSIKFTLTEGRPIFQWLDDNEAQLAILRGEEKIPFLDYLAARPIDFYLPDFSRLRGNCLFRNDPESLPPFDQQCIKILNWTGINIEIEARAAALNTTAPQSVQEVFGSFLLREAHQVVIFDHGAGEIADFVTLLRTQDSIIISLFHCKGAGGPNPGDRVADVYEVCGQVVKSLGWLKSKDTLRRKLNHRFETHLDTKCLRGTPVEMRELLNNEDGLPLTFRIGAVQPGLASDNLSDKIGLVLSSSADFVRRASGAQMWLYCS